MTKTVAIVNSQAPFSAIGGKDALDVALIFGAYEQKVSLFFQGEGVWQLVKGNQADLLTTKDYLKTYAALEFYDIEHVYVCQQSLQTRQLEHCFHIDDVTVLSARDFAEQLASNQVVFRL